MQAARPVLNRDRRTARVAARLSVVAKSDPTHNLSWPWWAPWALLAVVATSVLTVAATLYDIL
jgi:hypothetical protein